MKGRPPVLARTAAIRKGGAGTEQMILEGKRCHEAKADDVDADGDIDICTKPWNGSLHVYLRNLLVEDTK